MPTLTHISPPAGPCNRRPRPLKAYILAGQSNMEGHTDVRTFDYIGIAFYLGSAKIVAQIGNAFAEAMDTNQE